jgi:hypothetical protein
MTEIHSFYRIKRVTVYANDNRPRVHDFRKKNDYVWHIYLSEIDVLIRVKFLRKILEN